MLKIGRSEIAQRSALAHTGSLVGADGVTDAVLRKLGVTRVDTVDDLYEAIAVFHARKLPRGGGVAPVSVSGGAGGLLADLAQGIGVSFPPLPEPTAAALRKVVPEYGSVGNPLDITGQGVFEPQLAGGAIEQLAQADNLDIVVWARSFPCNLDRATPVGQILERAVETYPDVLFLVMSLVSGHFYPAPGADLELADPVNHLGGIPFLQGSESSLKAIAALIRYAEFQRARRERNASGPRERLTPESAARRARGLLRAVGGRALTERESKVILALYGIRTTREILATDSEHAVAAAEEIGYPVALKAESPLLLHKNDAGAVILNVTDEAMLRSRFKRALTNAWSAVPSDSVTGVLVQEMVPPGTEVIIGMSRDPQFGPIIACGLGGVFVETLKDVQLLVPPISEAEARQALARLRGSRLFDHAAIVDVLLRFSELCLDVGDLVQEIDVNPLIVAAGQGACAVDCLIVPAT
jgi:acetyltransferase